jgi:hypothetical protein
MCIWSRSPNATFLVCIGIVARNCIPHDSTLAEQLEILGWLLRLYFLFPINLIILKLGHARWQVTCDSATCCCHCTQHCHVLIQYTRHMQQLLKHG